MFTFLQFFKIDIIVHCFKHVTGCEFDTWSAAQGISQSPRRRRRAIRPNRQVAHPKSRPRTDRNDPFRVRAARFLRGRCLPTRKWGWQRRRVSARKQYPRFRFGTTAAFQDVFREGGQKLYHGHDSEHAGVQLSWHHYDWGFGSCDRKLILKHGA